ncbi:hypothetical protein QWJ07_03825 [Frankia sp. RB7]|nr:hypothetical protein [Frankia sp. RB7]
MLLLRTMKDKTVKNLHENTKQFIKQFARDHMIALSGTDKETTDREERFGYFNGALGGHDGENVDVEKVVFTPEHFSFNYKGAKISGPLSGVQAETKVIEDGREWNCDVDDIEGAVEKACGFPIDPCEVEEPEMDF